MSELLGTGTVAAVENQSQPAVNVAEQPAEKMLPQSQVDDIVKRAKSQAVENYKKLYAEQPEYAQKKYGDPAPVYAQHISSSNSVNEDAYRKIAAEEAQRMRDEIFSQAQQRQQEEQAQRIVQKFYNKVSGAKEAYEDLIKLLEI